MHRKNESLLEKLFHFQNMAFYVTKNMSIQSEEYRSASNQVILKDLDYVP